MTARRFGDLYEVPSRNGVSVPKGDRSSGFQMINMGELFRFGRIGDSEMARVPLSEPEIARSLVEPGDLLFARRSLQLSGAGRCSLVVLGSEPRTFESSIIRVRLNQDVASPEFYYYFFGSRQGRSLMETIVEQAVVAGIRASDLRELEVPFPPLAEQRGIASTLGTLDDKIESNRRAVALIHRLIRAKVTAALEYGADAVAVSSLARFVNGGAYTKGGSGTGRMVIRIAELNGGPGGSTVYNDIDVPDEKTARPGDILMSWSGSLGVYRWTRDEAIINQHIFKVIPTSYPAWLVFDRVEAVIEIFRGIAKDKATTMGHIQRGHLDSTRADIPGVDAIKEMDASLAPLWDRLLIFERESLTLASLRDALLPGLLSGRIRVSEAVDAITHEIPEMENA